MCGPYVHGRSWETGMRDITEAEVLVLEEMGVLEVAADYTRDPVEFDDYKQQYLSMPRSHGKTASVNWWKQTQANQTSVVDVKLLKKMQDVFNNMKSFPNSNKQDFANAFLYGKPKYLAIDPAMKTGKVGAPKEIAMEFDGKKQVPTFQHYCKPMECNAHCDMPKRDASLYNDWGIQPWDGKVVSQRGKMTSRLKMEIEKQEYMMNTKEDLLAWCEKHWDTHEDGGEWCHNAHRFLDMKKFLSFLPIKYKQGISELALNHVGSSFTHGILLEKEKPVEVFANMLDDAPNDYWKDK